MIENAGTFLAFVNFAFVTSITPGPNNFMVMASGAAFGWRRTLPHMIGIAFGFSAMMSSVVLGLGAILQQFPQILAALRVVGALWLLWLAWQLAISALRPAPTSTNRAPVGESSRPMRFYEAALFQWVNPKAWTMAIAASAAYSTVASDPVSRAFIMTTIFIVAAIACNSAWTLAGQGLQRLMMVGNASRIVSLIMAALVVLSAALILIS